MTITDKYVAALGEIAELKEECEDRADCEKSLTNMLLASDAEVKELKEQIENMSILMNAQKGELNELKEEFLTEEEVDVIFEKVIEENKEVFNKLAIHKGV